MPTSQQQLDEWKRWFTSRIPVWQRDPLLWIREVLGGAMPWSRQEEILRALVTHDEINVATGHSVGKDWLMGRVVLWWVLTYPDSIVLTTGPTKNHVETVLWGEVRTAWKRSKYLKQLFPDALLPVEPLLRFSEGWYAKGLVGKDAESFQGHHAPHVLVIIDEAAGVSSEAEEALLSCAVSSTSKIVRIGNPTCGPTDSFAKAFRDQSPRVKNIRISSLETPNYVHDSEVIPGLMTRRGVERLVRKCGGTGNDAYRSRVLGLFPAGSTDSLITAEHIGAARSRWVERPKPKGGRLGVDVARYGNDLTGIAYVADGQAWLLEMVAKADGVAVAKRLAELVAQYEAVSVAIDGGGQGSGPVDTLVDFQRRGLVPSNLQIYDCLFGAGATDKTEWANRRSELWHRLRDWLWTEGSINPDAETEEELLAVTRKWRSGTAALLEPKEQVTARIGRSPDRADALALAVAGHVGKVRQAGAALVHWV